MITTKFIFSNAWLGTCKRGRSLFRGNSFGNVVARRWHRRWAYFWQSELRQRILLPPQHLSDLLDRFQNFWLKVNHLYKQKFHYKSKIFVFPLTCRYPSRLFWQYLQYLPVICITKCIDILLSHNGLFNSNRLLQALRLRHIGQRAEGEANAAKVNPCLNCCPLVYSWYQAALSIQLYTTHVAGGRCSFSLSAKGIYTLYTLRSWISEQRNAQINTLEGFRFAATLLGLAWANFRSLLLCNWRHGLSVLTLWLYLCCSVYPEPHNWHFLSPNLFSFRT